MTSLAKPSYSTSKLALWISGGCAWLLVFIIVLRGAFFDAPGALALAPIVIPSMVMMIVALLGVHRAFGSMDMRTIAGSSRPPRRRRELEPDQQEGQP